METVIFYTLPALILATSALVVFRPRPIESAMWLVLNFFFTAALFVVLGAHFAAVIQVLVYAGAILVLFVFVIFLLNIDPKDLGLEAQISWSSLVFFVGSIAFVLLAVRVATPDLLQPLPELPPDSKFGDIEAFSRTLLTKYVWSFEVAGVLLLLAILGVGMLAYRKPRARAISKERAL